MPTITLISVAKRGIGLATASQLAKAHGHHILVGSRDFEAGTSIEAAAETIEAEFGRLVVLVNTVGVLYDTKDIAKDIRDLFAQTLAINVVGTARLTDAKVPLIRKSALPLIVFVSSRRGSLAQATVRGTPFYPKDYKAYEASKAAVNTLALNYSRILGDTGARVNVACPGLVATNMTGYMSYGSTPQEGAKRIVESATLGMNGPCETFSDRDGEIA